MNTSPDTDSYTSTVTAGPGGAMTDEAGVITGDLTVRTTLTEDGRRACVTVQYTDADEWYTLTGSPAPITEGGLAAYHRDVLGRIRRGQGAMAT
ncbi:hypothetical protein A6P39_044160 (plasmid) [Streptomyces sp. FXJ1.172]|uniref:hypothetical protein n=1 Tax=Streptomyces sp. FXJ1.172 TaxID=710705 RepID=UPI0023DD00BD|nr:hypothetical protein [Streptomyces sp. FXJ1.172]WEP00707.1 hypothetical protein A6P39_044160 [Streptomyces sp. FXJ1.172]